MNEHQFASGLVYKKPKLFCWCKVLILCLHKIFFRISTCIKKYYLWGINLDKAKFGDNVYLGWDSYLSNSGNPQNIVFGDNVIFKGSIRCEQNGRCIIGNNVHVGDGTVLSVLSEVVIRDNVQISYGVSIFDNISHPLNAKSRHSQFCNIMKLTGEEIDDFEISAKPIVIEKDAWIGFNSIIFKGVTIGEGAIIGAGTVITKDVPANAVMVGNPAKCVKFIN